MSFVTNHYYVYINSRDRISGTDENFLYNLQFPEGYDFSCFSKDPIVYKFGKTTNIASRVKDHVSNFKKCNIIDFQNCINRYILNEYGISNNNGNFIGICNCDNPNYEHLL